MRLVLASASPRRLELLRAIGADPLVRPADVREGRREGEPPPVLVSRLAELKARSVLQTFADAGPFVVLGADTEVVLDGDVLGKPRDRAEAEQTLRRLRGRVHEVLTGVALVRRDDGRGAAHVETTRVRFREFDEPLLRWYSDSGEPLDKAGAYGIQGRGALLASRVDGSWSNVVGLPIEGLPDLFGRIGLDLLDFLRR